MTFPDISSEYLPIIDLCKQNKIHVISHCSTHIFSHNYDNYVLYAQLYLVKHSFLAYSVSRTILAVTDHMQEHISPSVTYLGRSCVSCGLDREETASLDMLTETQELRLNDIGDAVNTTDATETLVKLTPNTHHRSTLAIIKIQQMLRLLCKGLRSPSMYTLQLFIYCRTYTDQLRRFWYHLPKISIPLPISKIASIIFIIMNTQFFYTCHWSY